MESSGLEIISYRSIGGSLSLHVQLALLGHVGHALVSGRKENWAMAGQSSQITDDVRPDEGRAGQCHCSDDCNGVNIFLAGNPSNHHEQTCACLQRRACYFCIRCQTSRGTKWSENCVKAKTKESSHEVKIFLSFYIEISTGMERCLS